MKHVKVLSAASCFSRRAVRLTPALFSAVVASQVLAVSVAPAWAQGISVRLNGTPVSFREASPTKISGKVLVPMREVFSVMQATIKFAPETRTITATRGNREIQLTIGSTQAFINGSPIALSQPAQLINYHTFVPLRFVADALGAQVDWNEASQTVSITDASLGDNIDGGGNGGLGSGINNNPNGVGNGVGNGTIGRGPSIDRKSIEAVVQRIDAEFPPRLVTRVGNALRSFDVSATAEVFRQNSVSNSANGAPFYGPLTPIELADLSPNEEVHVSVGAEGQATKIVALRLMQTARVRSAQGNQIVLDNGTIIGLNSQLRYTDAQGRASTSATVAPNQSVAVFLRPGSDAIYQISSLPTDVAAAEGNGNRNNGGNGNNGGNPNPNPNPSPNPNPNPNGNGPRVAMVTHNAPQPLRAGAGLTVTVRGTQNLKGTFDLSPRLQNLPLTQAQPGVYRGVYVVKAGDDVLNGYVTARLSDNAGNEDVAQSTDPFTFDTIAPREIKVSPANGEAVTDARPTITITIDDIGGSGLGFAKFQVAGEDGQAFDVPATIVPPSTVTAQIPRAMSGRVTVKWTVGDKAKNGRSGVMTFNVQARQGAITSVAHSATRPLRVGDALRVDMTARPGGRATFDVLDENNQVVVNRVPMTELNANQGRYQGTYTLANNIEATRLKVRAHFTDADGTADTLNATNDISLTADAGVANRAFSISTPTDNGAVASPITIRGRATPGSLVDVTVTARGTKTLFGLIGYKEFVQVLDTQQVQADAAGAWLTRPVALKAQKGVTDLKFEISATQTDAGNQKSQPETVTVTLGQ